MRRDECGEAPRTAGNRGTWLHDSLSELEPTQAPQDHAGIASGFTGRLFECVHLFLAGRDEDRECPNSPRARPEQCPDSARTVPAQCPDSARTVPNWENTAFSTFLMF